MGRRRSARSGRASLLARYDRHRRANLLAAPGRHDLIIVLDHLKAGFNVAKIFRSAEVFGVREVHLVGIGPFDPAPAKGGFKAVPAYSYESMEESLKSLTDAGYHCFRLTPSATVQLPGAVLPRRCALVFGHEEHGFSFDPEAHPGVHAIGIRQFGRIDSLNVSVAASVAMYEYARQHAV